MVGPVSDEERSSFARKLKVGLTLVVGLSAGLIAVNGDATTAGVVGALAAGLVVGAALVWFLFRVTAAVQPDRDGRRRRR